MVVSDPTSTTLTLTYHLCPYLILVQPLAEILTDSLLLEQSVHILLVRHVHVDSGQTGLAHQTVGDAFWFVRRVTSHDVDAYSL